MKFSTCSEVKAAEEALFSQGVSAEELMEDAGRQIAATIIRRCSKPGQAIAFIGKGNNGGDALVVLRHLREAGWRIGLELSHLENELSELSAKNLKRLGPVDSSADLLTLSTFQSPLVLIDGLLGIGTKGELREPLAALARKMKSLQDTGAAEIVSIDVPSGLNVDMGTARGNSVRADLTCVIGIPKRGLVKDSATHFVGSLSFIPLRGLSCEAEGDRLITPSSLPVAKLQRSFDFHKGEAGRIGIVAGGRGTFGAALLSSLGALHGGGGLITLYALPHCFQMLAAKAPAEVMVKKVSSYLDVLKDRLDALVIGPGLKTKKEGEIVELIERSDLPAVIDAEALNSISRFERKDVLTSRHLITPHPGEMSRLFPEVEGDRATIARQVTGEVPCAILFKGARTIVAQRGHSLAYNTTGTPGMATGGSGDLLSGLCAAFLALDISPYDAACLGAWLAGRAAELAMSHGGESVESVTPSRSAAFLGLAFRELRTTLASDLLRLDPLLST